MAADRWDISSGPGVTALGLAAARSVETGRPDRLIEDPFARGLFEAAGVDLPMLVDWPESNQPASDTEALHLHGSRYIGLRTRYYDDAVLAAAANGIGQAVLIGAGLDTRAFRLDLPSRFHVFELDQEGVLEFKDATLSRQGAKPLCTRSAIGIDLRDDWPAALQAAGFEPVRPTVWAAEGLLAYLPAQAQAGLLGAIHDLSAPGSVVALDHIAGKPTAARLQDLSDRSGIDMEKLMTKQQGIDAAAFFDEHGWSVEGDSAAAVAERYGRDLGDPFSDAANGERGSEPPWLETRFLSAVSND